MSRPVDQAREWTAFCLTGALLVLGVPAAASAQEPCPPRVEQAERMMARFTEHPVVAEPPYPAHTAVSADFLEMLGATRERIGLVGLRPEEIRHLSGGEDEIVCRSLRVWLRSWDPMGHGKRYTFFEARNRYIVLRWLEREPGAIRVGRYSMLAVLDRQYALIDRVGL